MNSSLFEFILLLGKLKVIRRTGWVRSGVKDPESIADHMYRMGVLSIIVDPTSDINKDKCIKLSLIHDLAESIVGDITPNCGVSTENKYLMEKNAMLHIKSLLPLKVGDEIMDLWQEYEDQKTMESKIVKDLDKFDMVFQAFEYEKTQGNLNLQDFFDSTKDIFETPQIKSWAKCLYEMRNSSNNLMESFNERITECKKSILNSVGQTKND